MKKIVQFWEILRQGVKLLVSNQALFVSMSPRKLSLRGSLFTQHTASYTGSIRTKCAESRKHRSTQRPDMGFAFEEAVITDITEGRQANSFGVSSGVQPKLDFSPELLPCPWVFGADQHLRGHHTE